MLLFILALGYGCAEKDKYEELKVEISLSLQNMEIYEGEEVYFSGKATGGLSPYTFSWKFGTGIQPSSLKTPGFITFKFEGAYKVILTVKDSRGITGEDYVYISVKNKYELSPKN